MTLDQNRADSESSRLVGAYRRLVPLETRRAIVERVGPGARAQIKRALAVDESLRLLSNGRRARSLRRSLGSSAEAKVVVSPEGVRIAQVRPGLRPLTARQQNLDIVRTVLDGAGIGYFAVRGVSELSAALGVHARDRAAVLRALRSPTAELPGYVAPVTDRTVSGRVVGPDSSDGAWEALGTASVLRFTQYLSDASGRCVLGADYGCDVEFWTEEDGELVAPRENRGAERVLVGGPSVEAPARRFTRLLPAGDRQTLRTRPEFAELRPEEIDFPIDVVYTWVDGGDPAWQRRKAAASGEVYHPDAASDARYLSRDELRYSLRSLHQFAPWVRTVHLVTDDQVPEWLDQDAPGIRVVSHRDIFSDPSVLPTFNSHAIESQLHHIEGLSEQFVYFNDDVFLGLPVTPQDFFYANGISRFFQSPALVPPGEPHPDAIPVSVAGMNNRRLIKERFGTSLVHKMKHMPHALQRSVLAEIEKAFPEEHRATMAAQFRSRSDIATVSSLHHYFAFSTGRAVPGGMRYMYADLGKPDTPKRLADLLRLRNRKVFCLNDSVSTAADAAEQSRMLADFLGAYFPVPSPFERVDDPR